ncbi:hypothetical protein [Candidatus Accumulibacter phosphatis]|uniref:hypothetical protein n=1 Tax=Candidatus Accumulibacter phosphatis TaxID=327160 RepID=UPI00110BA8E6|nr:hypothetical protein [Candidatus Accumulibacter phosphatis]
MSDVIANANQKLDEASFYLNLMDRIEMERSSLTKNREASIEFSYLLSAFLNACYSCAEHLKQNKSNVDIVKQFRNTHSNFYASGPNGGWRTQAVHFRPVKPEHDGYIPPPGNNVIFRFRESKLYIPPKGDSVKFQFGPGSFYFSSEQAQNSICDVCATHLHDLKNLIALCS